MTDFAASIVAWLITYAVHSTLLLAAAAIATALLTERVAWRETLWKVALVGGLLTATAQSALGVSPLGGRWEMALAIEDRVRSGSPWAPRSGLTVRADAATSAADGAPVAVPGLTSPSRRTLNAILDAWPELALGAWAATALVLLGVLANRQRRLHRLLRDRRQVEDVALLRMLNELRRKAGVRRHIWLTMSSRCSTPLAIGLSEICVPRHLVTELTAEEQRSALGHELAHLVRRDTLWEFAAGTLIAVFFFQPLNRVARRRWREAAEELCDDWVVRETGCALGMARCLSRVASWLTAPPEPVLPGTMAMAEGGSLLSRRVARLMAEHVDRTLPRTRNRGAAACVLLIATTGVAPVVGSAPTSPPLSPQDVGRAFDLGPQVQDVDQALESLGAAAVVDQALDSLGAAALMDVIRSGARLEEREQAVEALGQLGRGSGAVDLLVSIASGPYERALQEEAVQAIGDAGRDEDVGVLERIARMHPDRHVREEAVEALGDRGNRVFEVLDRLLPSETSADVRKEAVDELADMAHPEVPDLLFRVAMNDPDEEVQEEAVEGLVRFRAEDVAPLIRRIVWEHTLRPTRLQAAEAAGELPAAVALPVLDEIVDRHPDAGVVVEAVDAIAGYPSSESIPRLRRILSTHPQPEARREAREELGDRGD